MKKEIKVENYIIEISTLGNIVGLSIGGSHQFIFTKEGWNKILKTINEIEN